MAARVLIAIGLAMAATLLGVSTPSAAVIDGASIQSKDQIVELHFEVRGRGLKWSSDAHGQQLWIELEHARLDLAPRLLEGQESFPITLVRAIDAGGGRARLVVGVSGKVDYAIARMPHELVVRVAPAGKVPALAAPLLAAMETSRAPLRLSQDARPTPPIRHYQQTPEPMAAVAAAPKGILGAASAAPPASGMSGAEEAARPALSVAALVPPNTRSSQPVVVIDPGHGGHDPGAQAPGIVAEKDEALAIAIRLRNALEARGVDARLTRDDDRFLSLSERTRIANQAAAGLFISIHLNSSPDSNTTGIETYYLNNTTDRATIRLARMENEVAGGYSAPGQPNLNYILTDMRQGYKANESASLARMIEAETVADAETSLGLKVNALGAKMGPFYVLVGAEMPAVLVECGFLSNPEEARMLAGAGYQQALADGIAAAAVHYFNGDAAVGNL